MPESASPLANLEASVTGTLVLSNPDLGSIGGVFYIPEVGCLPEMILESV